MQRLVSPELKIYMIPDRGALSELVTELRLDSTLAGNLRQLLGFQTVGPGRQARQVAGDWQLLESVRWLIHLESGKLVPVVGSNAIRMFKRCCPQTPDAPIPRRLLSCGASSDAEAFIRWRHAALTPSSAAATRILGRPCLHPPHASPGLSSGCLCLVSS